MPFLFTMPFPPPFISFRYYAFSCHYELSSIDAAHDTSSLRLRDALLFRHIFALTFWYLLLFTPRHYIYAATIISPMAISITLLTHFTFSSAFFHGAMMLRVSCLFHIFDWYRCYADFRLYFWLFIIDAAIGFIISALCRRLFSTLLWLFSFYADRPLMMSLLQHWYIYAITPHWCHYFFIIFLLLSFFFAFIIFFYRLFRFLMITPLLPRFYQYHYHLALSILFH